MTLSPVQADHGPTHEADRGPDMPELQRNTIHPASKTLWMGLLAASAVVGGLITWLIGWNIALFVVVTIVVFMLAVYIGYRVTAGHRQGLDQVVRALVYLAFALAVIPLIWLLWTVFSNAIPPLLGNLQVFTQDMYGISGDVDEARVTEGAEIVGGMKHALIGTLMITVIASIISIPVGLMAAIYLVEYGTNGWFSRTLRFLVDVMTGIPSIVAGLFAYALFSMIFGPGTKFGFAGAIALSVLMIPIVVRNSEEMLRVVSRDLRESALALGVPKWRVITKIVLPTAVAGLMSSVFLGVARVIGETAPLLVAAGYNAATNWNPFEGPMNSLAFYAYQLFQYPLNPGYREVSDERSWIAVFVLVMLVLTLNLIARLVAAALAPKKS
ncbi:phosphate ABC transporter permease PstA [Kytococcus sedentarius]|uniref:Phosphate transport system permease protein PstA n=1 Tax=Kytococcus sedentarius (strain ATCC 14392 / DSM 20547 / JCM 11482 / CCUG 33030 / NBRC 15357 / NCTC 11040 / CCM 314 / 541) TaxID=478801 RepID=C7NLU0_KYTSD|nr:phosphate ABC transporter permease PstA [Kytococcus sedentarius]ACV05756.1 phosphate ABC transporter, permease protein PstA [Kytococcus sedentarius DSM 20547]STX12831.1 Phosphate transport system permease protein pstA [Kytococcus sedentarius]